MSYNQITDMSKVIGQIEDELRDIKSAKEQSEAVIGSNKALSDSLQSLFDSSSNVAKVLENNVQQIIAEINNKIELLNIQAADIESYAQQGMSKISEQSSLAQTKLEDDLGNLVQKLTDIISSSTNQSIEAIGNELAGYPVLIHEATKTYTDSTSDAIAKQEGHIAEIGNLTQKLTDVIYASTNQSIEAIGNDLAGYNVLVNEAAKNFADSTSVAIAKQEGQIAEISKLVTCIEEKQHALDSKIEEIRQLDILRLLDEISEIHRIESETATATKKWRVVEIRALGVCIVLGIVILIKLLVM